MRTTGLPSSSSLGDVDTSSDDAAASVAAVGAVAAVSAAAAAAPFGDKSKFAVKAVRSGSSSSLDSSSITITYAVAAAKCAVRWD